MKHNEASKALYNLNAAIFRGLHINLGFDFEKPITIKELPAPFTIRAAYKAIEPDGLNQYNAVVGIIMHDSRPGRYDSTPRLVPLHLDGIRDDYDRMSYHEYDTAHHYMQVFDDFCRKGDFHELRKAKTCEAWIIAQADEHIHKYKAPERDWTQRQRDMDPGEHERHTTHNYYRKLPPIIIDKSNYRVDMKRDDLNRRAAKLKADRAKEAADAATIATAADRYNDMIQALYSARQRIIKALTKIDFENVTADTVNALKATATAIGEYSFHRGISAAANNIIDFERNTKEKKYTTPDRYNAAYNSIIDSLNAIMPEV